MKAHVWVNLPIPGSSGYADYQVHGIERTKFDVSNWARALTFEVVEDKSVPYGITVEVIYVEYPPPDGPKFGGKRKILGKFRNGEWTPNERK